MKKQTKKKIVKKAKCIEKMYFVENAEKGEL